MTGINQRGETCGLCRRIGRPCGQCRGSVSAATSDADLAVAVEADQEGYSTELGFHFNSLEAEAAAYRRALVGFEVEVRTHRGQDDGGTVRDVYLTEGASHPTVIIEDDDDATFIVNPSELMLSPGERAAVIHQARRSDTPETTIRYLAAVVANRAASPKDVVRATRAALFENHYLTRSNGSIEPTGNVDDDPTIEQIANAVSFRTDNETGYRTDDETRRLFREADNAVRSALVEDGYVRDNRTHMVPAVDWRDREGVAVTAEPDRVTETWPGDRPCTLGAILDEVPSARETHYSGNALRATITMPAESGWETITLSGPDGVPLTADPGDIVERVQVKLSSADNSRTVIMDGPGDPEWVAATVNEAMSHPHNWNGAFNQ